jgi:uncharacterized protein YecT (DUF1311 family)
MACLRSCLCVALTALAVSNVPCLAQRSDAPTNLCQGLANVPTQVCFGDEYAKASKELDGLESRIRDALDRHEDRERFDRAEDAWKKGRELTCDAESRVYFDIGSGRPTEAAACGYVETRLRIKDLHAIYDWRVEWMSRQRE